jgi:hypothetical protein
MDENTPTPSKNIRRTTRQRVSRKPVQEEKATSPVDWVRPPKEEIFDEIFWYVVQIQKRLIEKHFKPVTVGNGNITIPRYFNYQFQKNNRSPHEFQAALQSIKTELDYLGFKPTPTNAYLYYNPNLTGLYIFVKRYTQASVLGLYVMRFYNSNVPNALDLM